MELFNYNPQFLNNFQSSYKEASNDNKKEFLKNTIEFYKNNVKKFYYKNGRTIIEKYKIFDSIIQNKLH